MSRYIVGPDGTLIEVDRGNDSDLHNLKRASSGNGRGRYFSEKSSTVAMLLCLLLGVFGVHKFYVGKKGWGIAYIFTYGLFGIAIFIDPIIILFGQFKDSDGKKLKTKMLTVLLFFAYWGVIMGIVLFAFSNSGISIKMVIDYVKEMLVNG